MGDFLNVRLSRWHLSFRTENDHKTAHVGQLCMGASPCYTVDSLVDIELSFQLLCVNPAIHRLDKRPFRAQDVERQPFQLVQRAPHSPHVSLSARSRLVLRRDIEGHDRPGAEHYDRQAAVNDVECTTDIRWSDECRARRREGAFHIERRHRARCWWLLVLSKCRV